MTIYIKIRKLIYQIFLEKTLYLVDHTFNFFIKIFNLIVSLDISFFTIWVISKKNLEWLALGFVFRNIINK